MPSPSIMHIWETEAVLPEDPILIEVDSRIFDLVRDLTILAATALQIASGCPQNREVAPDGIIPQATTNWAYAASTGGSEL